MYINEVNSELADRDLYPVEKMPYKLQLLYNKNMTVL